MVEGFVMGLRTYSTILRTCGEREKCAFKRKRRKSFKRKIDLPILLENKKQKTKKTQHLWCYIVSGAFYESLSRRTAAIKRDKKQ